MMVYGCRTRETIYDCRQGHICTDPIIWGMCMFGHIYTAVERCGGGGGFQLFKPLCLLVSLFIKLYFILIAR